MKPILFNPDLPSERINRTADGPAAIVAEICGQLMAGVTDIEELAQAIYSADLVEEGKDAEKVVEAVLEMLVALGFAVGGFIGYRAIRPIALGESFTDYFEEKFKEEDDD